MGRILVKVNDGERDWYMEWSTIVDAPVTYGMSRDELETWYASEYGREGAAGLPSRLARVDAKGTSAIDDASAWDTMWLNRAGKGESRLSLEQIIDYYCKNRPTDGTDREPPMGEVNDSEEDDDD